jgi:CheY-like chemotaxis protein
MDTETCSHAFEPFFTTKKAGGNSGLGLSMVYGIAADHQGWTECESALGAGTTVSVFFPATADRDATGARPAPQPASAAEPPVGAEQLRGSETILVIADVDRFRGVLDLMLERSGYASLLGRGARDGLEVYRHQHRQIDLVVIGLSTPEMSVQEVLAGLRRIDPAVRALVLTGQDPDEPSWSGTAALGKPFNTAQLLRAVRRCLDG